MLGGLRYLKVMLQAQATQEEPRSESSAFGLRRADSNTCMLKRCSKGAAEITRRPLESLELDAEPFAASWIVAAFSELSSS
jgi:hypothetical protein